MLSLPKATIPSAMALFALAGASTAEALCNVAPERWQAELGPQLIGEWRTEMIEVRSYDDGSLRDIRPDPLVRAARIEMHEDGLRWNDGSSDEGYPLHAAPHSEWDFALPGEAPLPPEEIIEEEDLAAPACGDGQMPQFIASGELDLGVLVIPFKAHFLLLAPDHMQAIMIMDMQPGDGSNDETSEQLRAVMAYTR